MHYQEDLQPDQRFGQANLFAPQIPLREVTHDDWAFYVQRTQVDKDFKGIVKAHLSLGSVALAPYLNQIISQIDRPYLSNDVDISVKNGDRVLISGNGDLNLWPAKKNEWFVISDIGNKLKTFTPSVVPITGYSIDNKNESLELNSVGSAWGGGTHDKNTLLFIFDGMTWRIGGQMKLADLFPQSTTTPETPTVSATDTTPPRIVLLDQPEANIASGNLIVNIRTLLTDEGNSTTKETTSTSSPLKMTFLSQSINSVSTVGEESLKIQMRIEE
jgi:hypothetical protein